MMAKLNRSLKTFDTNSCREYGITAPMCVVVFSRGRSHAGDGRRHQTRPETHTHTRRPARPIHFCHHLLPVRPGGRRAAAACYASLVWSLPVKAAAADRPGRQPKPGAQEPRTTPRALTAQPGPRQPDPTEWWCRGRVAIGGSAPGPEPPTEVKQAKAGAPPPHPAPISRTQARHEGRPRLFARAAHTHTHTHAHAHHHHHATGAAPRWPLPACRLGLTSTAACPAGGWRLHAPALH